MREDLAARLKGCVETWPAPLARRLESYLRLCEEMKQTATGEAAVGEEPEEPYWLLLPGWLEEKYAAQRAGERVSDGLLADALWAQWSLFLSVRIKDDLFDGDVRGSELILVSSLLRLESDRVLALHFRDRGFWDLARGFEEDTYRAAFEIDRLQRSQSGVDASALGLYARASSIFKLATTAVCWRRGALADVEMAAGLCDRFAVAGQIVDDLLDVEEDLERGRYNFAASRLMGPIGGAAGHPKPAAVLRDGFLLGPGPGGVLDEIRRQLAEAVKSAEALDLPPAGALAVRFSRALDRLRDTLHRLRVELVLGGLRNAG